MELAPSFRNPHPHPQGRDQAPEGAFRPPLLLLGCLSPVSPCLARLPAGASANPWVHVTGSPLCPWPSAFKNPVYYLEERSRPPPHPFWKCPSLRCHKLFLLPTSATPGCNASMFHSACGSHARPCLPSDVSFLRGGSVACLTSLPSPKLPRALRTVAAQRMFVG